MGSASSSDGIADPRRLAEAAEEHAALRRLARLSARGVPPAEIFDAVTKEAHQLLRPDLTVLARHKHDDSWTFVASRGGVSGMMQRHRFRAIATTPGVDDVLAGHAICVDVRVPGTGVDDVMEAEHLAAWVSSPIRLLGSAWGALIVFSRSGPLPGGTEERLTDRAHKRMPGPRARARGFLSAAKAR